MTSFHDAIGQEMHIGDKIVFYQPMSKVNTYTQRREPGYSRNNGMGIKARALQQATIKSLEDRPTERNPTRQVIVVDYNGEELILDRFERVAVVRA